jgi:2-keto-3-deoxy-L-rhamnonate aldolase RhmA
MVPQINTAAEAAEVVRLAKFPPLGARGQGSPFAALAHGVPTPQYLKQANDTLITMIQIETVEGLKNVRQIAAVPGVGEWRVRTRCLSVSVSLSPCVSVSLSLCLSLSSSSSIVCWDW